MCMFGEVVVICGCIDQVLCCACFVLSCNSKMVVLVHRKSCIQSMYQMLLSVFCAVKGMCRQV